MQYNTLQLPKTHERRVSQVITGTTQHTSINTSPRHSFFRIFTGYHPAIQRGVVEGESGKTSNQYTPFRGGGDIRQFTSASEAIVLLANEEPLPLPLLLCAVGLYGPFEVGLDPLGLLPFGEGGVWGLIC